MARIRGGILLGHRRWLVLALLVALGVAVTPAPAHAQDPGAPPIPKWSPTFKGSGVPHVPDPGDEPIGGPHVVHPANVAPGPGPGLVPGEQLRHHYVVDPDGVSRRRCDVVVPPYPTSAGPWIYTGPMVDGFGVNWISPMAEPDNAQSVSPYGGWCFKTPDGNLAHDQYFDPYEPPENFGRWVPVDAGNDSGAHIDDPSQDGFHGLLDIILDSLNGVGNTLWWLDTQLWRWGAFMWGALGWLKYYFWSLGSLVSDACRFIGAGARFFWQSALLAPEYAFWTVLMALFKYAAEGMLWLSTRLPVWDSTHFVAAAGQSLIFRYANLFLPLQQVAYAIALMVANAAVFPLVTPILQWLGASR